MFSPRRECDRAKPTIPNRATAEPEVRAAIAVTFQCEEITHKSQTCKAGIEPTKAHCALRHKLRPLSSRIAVTKPYQMTCHLLSRFNSQDQYRKRCRLFTLLKSIVVYRRELLAALSSRDWSIDVVLVMLFDHIHGVCMHSAALPRNTQESDAEAWTASQEHQNDKVSLQPLPKVLLCSIRNSINHFDLPIDPFRISLSRTSALVVKSYHSHRKQSE